LEFNHLKRKKDSATNARTRNNRKIETV